MFQLDKQLMHFPCAHPTKCTTDQPDLAKNHLISLWIFPFLDLCHCVWSPWTQKEQRERLKLLCSSHCCAGAPCNPGEKQHYNGVPSTEGLKCSFFPGSWRQCNEATFICVVLPQNKKRKLHLPIHTSTTELWSLHICSLPPQVFNDELSSLNRCQKHLTSVAWFLQELFYYYVF